MDAQSIRSRINFKNVIRAIDMLFVVTAVVLMMWYAVGDVPWYPVKRTFKQTGKDMAVGMTFNPWSFCIASHVLLIVAMSGRHLRKQNNPILVSTVSSFMATIFAILMFAFWGLLNFPRVGSTHAIFPLIAASWNNMLTSVYLSVYVSKNVDAVCWRVTNFDWN